MKWVKALQNPGIIFWGSCPYPVEMLHLKRSNFIAKQNTTIILKLPSGMHHHGAHNHNLCAFAIWICPVTQRGWYCDNVNLIDEETGIQDANMLKEKKHGVTSGTWIKKQILGHLCRYCRLTHSSEN